MDDPPSEISDVIHKLCESPPDLQRETIETYFLPDAHFTHPFCYLPPSPSSRKLLLGIYQYYKILSPKVIVNIHEITYHPNPHSDPDRALMYVHLCQWFRIGLLSWIYPWIEVSLVTKLKLERRGDFGSPELEETSVASDGKTREMRKVTKGGKWYIKSQEDLYQVNEWTKFSFPYFGNKIIVWLMTLAVWGCTIQAALLVPLLSFLGYWSGIAPGNGRGRVQDQVHRKPN